MPRYTHRLYPPPLPTAPPVCTVQIKSASADVRVLYRDKAQLLQMCKSLGLMEDLKAGVPRTAYHGVLLVRMHGKRLFIAPSYKVDQDITKPL
jgi:alpha-1,3-mannosyl-glycoprotein beta-1,2-N-acetylglucosaminyltransferase